MLKSLRKDSSFASSGGVVQVVTVAGGVHLAIRKPWGGGQTRGPGGAPRSRGRGGPSRLRGPGGRCGGTVEGVSCQLLLLRRAMGHEGALSDQLDELGHLQAAGGKLLAQVPDGILVGGKHLAAQ